MARPANPRQARGLAVLLLAVCMLGGPTPLARASDPGFVTSVVALTASGARLALRDLDADGRLELLAIGPEGIDLHRLDADGRFDPRDVQHMPWPAPDLAWDLADLDGDGATEVVMLVAGRSLGVFSGRRGAGLVAGKLLLDSLAGVLPAGVRHMRFVRDVNGDGRADLVIPGNDRYRIRLAGAPGSWGPPVEVAFSPAVELSLGSVDDLGSEFREAVDVPWFGLRDVDGDERQDLFSETDDRLSVYLADPLPPAEPSWVLDMGSLRDAVGGARFDPDNLLGMVSHDVRARVGDVDGVPPWDLVLQEGGRLSLYLGGSHGVDLERPAQVLKASGNLVYFLLRDADGDGRTDLQLVRSDDVSVGRVLRWLVLTGALSFDVYTYGNQGDHFSRHPSDRKSITLEIPPLLGAADKLREMMARYEQHARAPTVVACLDDDGRFDDVADVRDGRLLLFADCVPDDFQPGMVERVQRAGGIEAAIEETLLADLDRQPAGTTRSLDLEQVETMLQPTGWRLRQLTLERRPLLELALEPGTAPGPVSGAGEGTGRAAGLHPGSAGPDGRGPAGAAPTTLSDTIRIQVADLNADGRSDLLVSSRTGDDRHRLQVFVTHPR